VRLPYSLERRGMNTLVQDVHTIAERFLKDLESGKVSFYNAPEEVVIPTASPVVSKVTVMRNAHMPYLVGVKRDGTLVWSKDARHAQVFESDSMTLVNSISSCRKSGIYVETMPACWFHA
jgi:phosphoribosylformylglycinamidine (FGAM) synthase-like enzyme